MGVTIEDRKSISGQSKFGEIGWFRVRVRVGNRVGVRLRVSVRARVRASSGNPARRACRWPRRSGAPEESPLPRARAPRACRVAAACGPCLVRVRVRVRVSVRVRVRVRIRVRVRVRRVGHAVEEEAEALG